MAWLNQLLRDMFDFRMLPPQPCTQCKPGKACFVHEEVVVFD
jgi:hypothetical protein